FDHPMFGSYDAFFYHYLAGIRIDDDSFACDKITLKPVFAEGLDHAEATFSTVRGNIVSRWERKNGRIFCHFEIPSSISAKIEVGDLLLTRVSGKFDFVLGADGCCVDTKPSDRTYAGC
ncbi:MAG: hypothetical protein DBX39_06390, partial [Bacillota bacterium]